MVILADLVSLHCVLVCLGFETISRTCGVFIVLGPTVDACFCVTLLHVGGVTDFLGDDVTKTFPYTALSLVRLWTQLLRQSMESSQVVTHSLREDGLGRCSPEEYRSTGTFGR